jgi:hypothetical protein
MHIVRWIVGLVLTVLFIVHWSVFKDTLYPRYTDLSEIVHTYANFHKVKNVTFRYPKDTSSASGSTQVVPKILHHIWLQEEGENEYDGMARRTCTAMHRSEDG